MSPSPIPAVLGAEVIEIALPFRRPYASGTTHLLQRDLLLIRLITERGIGWGEAAPVPGYSTESLDECRVWLLAAAKELVAGSRPSSGPPSAGFAISAAIADLVAQGTNAPLWRSLGGVRDRVGIGAVIGIDLPLEAVSLRATELADDGYRRIKLKIDPSHGFERIAAVRRVLPDHDLAVDANGTFAPGDLAVLASLDGLDLSFIEQPFAANDLTSHTALASDIATPVCLDESITDLESARRAIASGAADIINIKPARVGGVEEALAIHDLALAAGVPTWCGGMLESGFGKAAALAVASLPGMTLPADLPPSRRHYASDLIEPPWDMEDGSILLPEVPGAGASPDWDQIDRHTVVVSRFGDAVGFRR